MQDYRSLALSIAETDASHLLVRQVLMEHSPDLGAICDPFTGLCNPGHTSKALRVYASVFLCKESHYYLDIDIAHRMQLALSFLERVQRPDGTFDLLTTNFMSAPDTGFMVHDLVYAYRLVHDCSSQEALALLSRASTLMPCDTTDTAGGKPAANSGDFMSRLRALIGRAGHGMCKGGFHTPNHRWVIAAALMMAHNVCGIERFSEAANCYLAEGIDCDCNGEFTERSAGIYNATNDNALVILAEESGRKELLTHVHRNLEMMFSYIDPDGSVFTRNSSRQDREGTSGMSPAKYLPLYLYMAHQSGNERFAAMAAWIARELRESRPAASDLGQADFLHLLMLKPGLDRVAAAEGTVPSTYEVFYEESGIVRIRRDRVSLSLVRNSSSFLFYQVGALRCRMKVCASFFAVAQFKAEQIYRTDEGYVMESSCRGMYRLPFEDPPETPDWRTMDHSKRKIGTQVTLATRIVVSEKNGGVCVSVRSKGCDRVPIKIELCFSAPAQIRGDGLCLSGRAGQSLVVRSGDIVVSDGCDAIRVGPGFAAHTYTETMRGSEPQSASEFTVYFTDFTNIDREITLVPLIPPAGQTS